MAPEPTTPTGPAPATKPTGVAPATPTGLAPQRPTATRPTAVTPTRPIPAPVSPVPPLSDTRPTSSPAPPTTTPIPEPAAPVPMAPVPSVSPPVPGPVPAADPALRAPTIDGAEPEGAKEAPRVLTAADLDAIDQERQQNERKNPKRWRHAGLIFDLQIGTAGCFRRFCRTEHNAGPGVHLGGFFGGNVLGILEIGLEAGWNTLRPRDVAGRNAVALYGLDPVLLQQEIGEQQGLPVEVDFSTLVVNTAKSRALNVGPSLRIHFIRKGRGLAYVGTGLHYQLWRNKYTTAGGDLRVDFHGLAAPFKVGGGAYVHPNIAVVGEFTYSLAFYVLGGVNHPDLTAVAPLALLEASAANAGSGLMKGLPHFGKFSVNLRFRF